MNDTDKRAFGQLMRATFEMQGAQPPSRDALAMWWAKCQPYTLEQVRAALSSYLDTGRGAPQWSQVRQYLPTAEGDWPAPEQAVAMMGFTENSTVVMCDEMAHAAFAVQEQFESGDRVGARINAKRIYEDAVRQAKAAGKRPRWRCIDGTGLRQEEREHARLQAWQAVHTAGMVSDSRLALAVNDIAAAANYESTLQAIRSMAADLPALAAPAPQNEAGLTRLMALLTTGDDEGAARAASTSALGAAP